MGNLRQRNRSIRDGPGRLREYPQLEQADYHQGSRHSPQRHARRDREVDRRRYLETGRAGGGSVMAKKWNMIVDIERCNNCRACFLAVKDEHTGNEFPGYAAEQPPHGTQLARNRAQGARDLSDRRCTFHARHVQSLRRCALHESAAKERRRHETRGRNRHHRSRKIQEARKQIVDACPVRRRSPGTRRSRYRRPGFSMLTCSMRRLAPRPGPSNVCPTGVFQSDQGRGRSGHATARHRRA